jgi:hypothetical protein
LTQRGLGPDNTPAQSAAPPDGTRRELTPAEHNAVMEKVGQLEASGKVYQTNPDGSLARDGMGNAQLTPEARELRQQLNAHTEAKRQAQSAERGTSPAETGSPAARAPQGEQGWASGPWAHDLGLAGKSADANPAEPSEREMPLGPNGRDQPSL